MEEFLHLGGSTTRTPFTFSSLPVVGGPPPASASGNSSFFYGVRSQNPNPNSSTLKLEPGSSTHYSTDAESIKAKIISHPQYPALLNAYMDCQKAIDLFNLFENKTSLCLIFFFLFEVIRENFQVGAPPEVVARLSSVTRNLEARQLASPSSCRPADPELDQFMVCVYYISFGFRSSSIEVVTVPI